MRDLYEVLGLPVDAGEEAIKTVYRQLARAFHPDVNSDPSAAAHFREITDAYVVLSHPELREQYDRQRAGVASQAAPAIAPRLTVTRPADALPRWP
ncbi:MAG TPA: DnaJ domain-containing protein [Myxococcales bacterium]|nr:DnaJ domain-containing protein [Myxococcales bacterium]